MRRGLHDLDVATLREYDLIIYWARHSGKTVSQEMLIPDAWRVNNRASSVVP